MTALNPAYIKQPSSGGSGGSPKLDGEPNGFIDRSEVTLSWDNPTRTLTVSPVGASFRLYSDGKKFTKFSPESIQIANTEGMHYVYYDANGVLVDTTTFDIGIINRWAFVSHLYWSVATVKAVPDAFIELHGCEMPADVHAYMHATRGTVYQTDGGLLVSVVADGNGSLPSHAEISATLGVIWDEDLMHSIPARAYTDSIPIIYRTGASQWKGAPVTPYVVTPGAGGRASYNLNTAGVWSLAEVAHNDYCLAHLYAIPGITNKWMIIMGQGTYSTVSAARDAAKTEILGITNLPMLEFKAIATVILQTRNDYTNAVKSRIVHVGGGYEYIDWRYTSIGIDGIPAGNIAILDGLSDVNAPSPANGDILAFDGATNAWVNISADSIRSEPLLDNSSAFMYDDISGDIMMS